jgi:hypothetical protein
MRRHNSTVQRCLLIRQADERPFSGRLGLASGGGQVFVGAIRWGEGAGIAAALLLSVLPSDLPTG